MKELTNRIVSLRVVVKSIIVQSKVLSDPTMMAESDMVTAARVAATSTSKMVVSISNSPETVQVHLLESAKQVRGALLVLITCAKEVVSNPFDFLTKQKLGNASSAVAESVKRILTDTKELEQQLHSSSFNEPAERTARSAPTSPRCFKTSPESSFGQDEVFFIQKNQKEVEPKLKCY